MCVLVPEKGWEGQERVHVSVSGPVPISSLCSQPRPKARYLHQGRKILFLPLLPTHSPLGLPFCD